jgi:2-keto-3-deoxy-L-rhamnonate aldolase RhmA
MAGALDDARPAESVFLQRLRAGQLTLMMLIRGSRTPEVVHIASSTGHHGIVIDLEHSPMSTDVAAMLCIVAGALEMTPLVRIPEREYGMIGRLLDGGAHGIVAPRIETVEQARTVTRACRFPPRGQRSQTTMVPQLGMRPTPASELNPTLDHNVVVQILIETTTGIENSDEIAALDGVDMIAIGANDLTAELGVPGRYDDPGVRDAVETVASACARHNKLLVVAGINDQVVYDDLVPLGLCPLVMTGTDSALLYHGAQASAQRAAAAFIDSAARDEERHEA